MRSLVPRSAGPWLAVLTLTAAGTAAAVGYALTAPKHYRATAQLLVSPVSVGDPTYTGLDVLRDTGGKHTAAATAAALLRSPQVADVVRADLGLPRSHDSLLKALHAHAVDSSDVVAVTIEDTTAAGAAQLANAFADALVKQRTSGFQSQLAATIRRDQQLLQRVRPAARSTGAGLELQKRLAVLQGFQGEPDPTVRHAGQASAPASAAWPKVSRLAAVGAGAGLAAGLLAALVLGIGRSGRRRVALSGAPYDLGVSERLVARLEKRITERIAALESERERLSAREASLAVREQEVAVKLGELRAASEAFATGPASAEPVEARADHAAAADALAAREAALEARVAELTQREVGLARRAAEIAQREKAARETVAPAAERPVRAAPEPVPPPVPAAVPEPEPAPSASAPAAAESERAEEAGGAWNLMVLERLVNDRAEEFPERRDEWSSYLYFLREYAEPDGRVPASFDWLIQETFSELVA